MYPIKIEIANYSQAVKLPTKFPTGDPAKQDT
jgi:virulence-associated protein VagC